MADQKPTIKSVITELLEGKDRPMGIDQIYKEVHKFLDTNKPAIRAQLNRLCETGKIQRIKQGVYAANTVDKRNYVQDESQETLDFINEDSDSLESPPTLPKIKPGIRFKVSESNQISIDRNGSAEDCLTSNQLPMYEALLSSINDFLDSSTGTNAYQHVRHVVYRYKETLVGKELSIDLLYAYGIRLENARLKLDKEIARGELPNLETKLDEPLDSILAIHGVSVLSTSRGKELISLSKQYNEQSTEDATYKDAAEPFVQAVQESKDLFESDIREEVEPFNRDIGEGRFPDRSRQVGRTFNLNLLLTIGSLSIATIDVGLSHSEIVFNAMISTGTISKNLAYSVINFLIQYQDILKLLAAAAREELSWLPRLIDWISRKRNNNDVHSI